MRLLLALVLLAGLSACSGGDDASSAEAPKEPSSSATEPPDDPGVEPSESEACAEVREGINAFNARDYAETVTHFRLAVPLAEDQARSAPSATADALLEAVTYYAELAPGDYPRSAISSRDFAKYKAITLGQCVPLGTPLEKSPTKPPDLTA